VLPQKRQQLAYLDVASLELAEGIRESVGLSLKAILIDA
jgi:hypothetical protein